MFYGEYQHSIDRKGRLIMPSKFREAAKAHFIEKFFITRGLDKCLFMFSEEEWRSQESKLKNISFTKQQARTFKKDVVVVGVSNRIEIWAKTIWQEFYQNSSATFEEIAQNLLDESVSGKAVE